MRCAYPPYGYCTRCGKVFCLEQMQPSFALTLPAGFRYEKAELTLKGYVRVALNDTRASAICA